ncbi:hypothetical protein [Arthrobacter sp. StoSoilB20]|uniref:hypothetical protein n=1 Tax=Arthrobacter sp. StoSoilB20 TaxID=2830995 RepID=UPI001CC42610|nr:hypothetical protein [Arthrobacter sp. StoSoilB20]BCW58630.1 hypothetical protein StoSoilB20_19770 [Arthrobacter sp. StoSoilB20]
MSHDTDRPPMNGADLPQLNESTGQPPVSLSVQVATDDNAHSRDQKISKAVDRLMPLAFERRHGILVTQQALDLYIIQVDPSVPCGTIHEKRH